MDTIIYIPDLQAFRAEVVDIYANRNGKEPHMLAPLIAKDENDNYLFTPTKIRVHYNGNESLCLVRGLTQTQIDSSNNLVKLGECVDKQYVFDSNEAQETYNRVRGNLEYTYVNPDTGETITGHHPHMIGLFF